MGKNKSVGCGCDYCMGRGLRRDFRHGASGDGWEDVPYRASRAGKKGKKKKQKRVGCPENNMGPHVYVWIRDTSWDGFLTYRSRTTNRTYHYERKVCCGCLKRYPGRKGYKKVYD